tara:strand:- start:321 stop:1166 length:846 start_codon:yes stop_codon:yes gene_type:complete
MRKKLFSLDEIIVGIVKKRPSINCQSPYVSDVQISKNKIICAHCPSLGCCGLCEANKTVILVPIKTKNVSCRICKYRIELAKHHEGHNVVYIGLNPRLAEKIVEESLVAGLIPQLELKTPLSYKTQVQYLNSRFDFFGIDKFGKEFFLEVKNVPIADYVNVSKKDRKIMIEHIKTKKFNEKIAFFPEGYRKKSIDPVSPRALKHVNELKEIAQNHNKRAILCFVIQREDVSEFQISNLDAVYKNAIYDAISCGVEIKIVQVKWTREGKCYLINIDVPIHTF